MAIDLDPGEGAGFDHVLDVARWVKDETGSAGRARRAEDFRDRAACTSTSRCRRRRRTRPGQLLCHLIATLVCDKHPKVATIERMVKKRPRGTVYVDYLQNILGKTLATAYSVRASDYAGVSTPSEVDRSRPWSRPSRLHNSHCPAEIQRNGRSLEGSAKKPPGEPDRRAGARQSPVAWLTPDNFRTFPRRQYLGKLRRLEAQ